MNTQNIFLYSEILAFCFILLVCLTGKVYQSEKPSAGGLLLRFNICAIFSVLVNFLWVNVNGNTITSVSTVKLVTVVYYFTINTAFYFWMRYSESTLYPAATSVKSYVFLSATPYLVTNILVVASCFFDWIFTVDNLNTVQTGPVWVIEYIYIFATLLWSAGTAFSFTKKTADPEMREQGTRLALFIILPFICIMLHVFTKSTPLSVIALSLLSIFSYRELKQAEIQEANAEAARREQEYLAKLQAAEQRADESEQRRIAFLRRVVFDFSSPLKTVNSLLEQVQSDDDPAATANCLKKIQSYNNYLSRIVAETAEMAELEAGTLQLQKNLTNLPEELIDLADFFQTQAEEKSVAFSTDFTTINDELVRHDSERLRQLLSNLFANALQNTTSQDEIQFTVQQVDPAVPDSASYIFSVSDSGRGMTQEEADHLFDVSDNDSESSTGFNLAIVKKLADLMNGRLNVESSPQTGTTISLFCSFELPTEDELTALQEAENESAEESDISEEISDSEDEADAVYETDNDYSTEADEEDDSFDETDDPADFDEEADESPDIAQPEDSYVPTEDEQTILNSVSVLVVENDPVLRDNACEVLASLGITAEPAVDGAEAIEKVRNATKWQYNLILMNIQMPHINGYEATQTIRSFTDKNLASLPIIAMDNEFTPVARQEAQRFGMNDLIAKPLRKRALVRIITKYY